MTEGLQTPKGPSCDPGWWVVVVFFYFTIVVMQLLVLRIPSARVQDSKIPGVAAARAKIGIRHSFRGMARDSRPAVLPLCDQRPWHAGDRPCTDPDTPGIACIKSGILTCGVHPCADPDTPGVVCVKSGILTCWEHVREIWDPNTPGIARVWSLTLRDRVRKIRDPDTPRIACVQLGIPTHQGSPACGV